MNDIIKTYNPMIRLWVAMVVVANGDREFGGFVYCSCQGGERERERERERKRHGEEEKRTLK